MAAPADTFGGSRPPITACRRPRSGQWRRHCTLPASLAGGAGERQPTEPTYADDYVADGVLAGPELNAADFQVGPLVRFLMGIRGFGEEVAQRPVAEVARRVLPG